MMYIFHVGSHVVIPKVKPTSVTLTAFGVVSKLAASDCLLSIFVRSAR